MCVQQSCIQCACHYYGSFASVIKSVPYYVVSTSLIRCVKLRSGFSGRFKRPGALGAYIPSIKFAEFYRKRFSRKLYMSVSHHPLFLLLEFVNSVSVFDCLFIYLFIYLFIQLFIFVCLFICQENVWYVLSIPLLEPLRKYTKCALHYILPKCKQLYNLSGHFDGKIGS